MEEGFLNEVGSVVKGIDYFFDDCSQTVSTYISVACNKLKKKIIAISLQHDHWSLCFL